MHPEQAHNAACRINEISDGVNPNQQKKSIRAEITFEELFNRYLDEHAKIRKLSWKDDLGYYIVAGVLFMFFTQVTVNIGINIGLLPVTGIPLPFLSYGGSSLIVMMIALGIVQSVARQSRILRF